MLSIHILATNMVFHADANISQNIAIAKIFKICIKVLSDYSIT